MIIFVIILLLAFILGIVYSFIVNKSSSNKLLLLMPAIIGSIWIVYIIVSSQTDPIPGLAGIAVMIYAIIVFAFIIGNILSSIYILYKKTKTH